MSAFDTIIATLLPPKLALSLARAGVQTPAPVLFDVGGNIGEWTLAAKQAWPAATVHSIEPSASHLQKFSAATGKLDGVTVNAAALGAEPGEAVLYKDAEITGLASMTKRDLTHVGLTMELSETIRVDTLDRYCAAHDVAAIDLLKIDVEGHEMDVLTGGLELLNQRQVAVIQFEFGGCNIDTRSFVKDFFESRRYALHIIGPGGRLNPVTCYREFNEQFATTNYIAIRQPE